MSLTFLVGQVGYMKRKGFEVYAIASSGEDLEIFAAREGVCVRAVEMPRRISPLIDLIALRDLCKALRNTRPHIIHASTPKGGLLGMIAAWISRVPIRIYHMRGLPLMTATGPKRMLLGWSERIACLLAHRVICVSSSLREEAISRRLCPPTKIKVLLGGSGNGVDATNRFNPCKVPRTARRETRAQYRIPDDALLIGFVGRVVRDKGVGELIQAWRMLRDEFPHAHLLVIGPIEPQDPLAAETASYLRHDPRIHLVGIDWDTPRLYAAMDLVVLPTYREGFPNVLLEAAAMELPVVATRVPGCIDAVLNGVTGMLVPPMDAHALAGAIRAYLVDRALRRGHGVRGRERVLKEFRQEAIWAAVYHEYCELLQERELPIPSSAVLRDHAVARPLAASSQS